MNQSEGIYGLIGAAIMGGIGIVKSIFSSTQRQKIAQMKIEANVKAAADKLLKEVTIEYDQKINNILNKVVMLTETVAMQTETIKHLETTLENIAKDFRMVVAISQEHIKDKSIVEIISKIGENTNEELERIKNDKRKKTA